MIGGFGRLAHCSIIRLVGRRDGLLRYRMFLLLVGTLWSGQGNEEDGQYKQYDTYRFDHAYPFSFATL